MILEMLAAAPSPTSLRQKSFVYIGTGASATREHGVLPDPDMMVWLRRRAGGEEGIFFPSLPGQKVAISTPGLQAASELTSLSPLVYPGSGLNAIGVPYLGHVFRELPDFFQVFRVTTDGSGVAVQAHGMSTVPSGAIVFRLTGPGVQIAGFEADHAFFSQKLRAGEAPVLLASGQTIWFQSPRPNVSLGSTEVTLSAAAPNSDYLLLVFGDDGEQIASGSYVGTQAANGQSQFVPLPLPASWIIVTQVIPAGVGFPEQSFHPVISFLTGGGIPGMVSDDTVRGSITLDGTGGMTVTNSPFEGTVDGYAVQGNMYNYIAVR